MSPIKAENQRKSKKIFRAEIRLRKGASLIKKTHDDLPRPQDVDYLVYVISLGGMFHSKSPSSTCGSESLGWRAVIMTLLITGKHCKFIWVCFTF